MPTVNVKAQVSTEDLLSAVSQLNPHELEQFVSQVVILQAQRRSSALSQSEAELLLKINRGVPKDSQERYDELIAMRQEESLNPDNLQELLDLTAWIESFDATRIENLAELARLRKTTLSDLMVKLGIRASKNA